jgi:LemA protein
MFIVLLILTALIVVWGVGAYNTLISLKNQVANAWKQVDVQLKRRHDLVPNLLAAVKGAMNFERSTLESVISARNQAIQVSASGDDSKNAAVEGQHTGALHRLLAVVESYPDLKATGNIAQLQEELTSTENKIAFARQLYNDVTTQYNTKQRQVPTVFIAGVAGAMPAPLWELTDDAERAVPKVEL